MQSYKTVDTMQPAEEDKFFFYWMGPISDVGPELHSAAKHHLFKEYLFYFEPRTCFGWSNGP
jgi:hypothetical protein